MRKEEILCVLEKKDVEKFVQYKYNPLMWVNIGTAQEISDARNVAKEIVLPMMAKPEVTAVMIDIITTVILHCMYAHYSDPKDYPIIPNLVSISNFLKINIIQELAWDEDRNPIYDINDDKRKFVIYPKGFIDTIHTLMDFQHVPWEGIEIQYLNKFTYDFSIRYFNKEDLHILYPEDTDIYEVNSHIHPLIYRNFMHFYENRKTNVFREAACLAPIAIDVYLDKYPEYREPISSHIKKEWNKKPKEPVSEFQWQPDGIVDDIILEKKGRKLKPVKEIIKDIIKQVF